MTTYTHSSETDEVLSVSETGVKTHHAFYHAIRCRSSPDSIQNNGTETAIITIEVVDGLQLARGETPAAVLAYEGDVTLKIDGAETTKPMTAGSVSFDISTSKPAGSTITVRAVGLNDHAAESDGAMIEVQ
jgi:hypothetical protein